MREKFYGLADAWSLGKEDDLNKEEKGQAIAELKDRFSEAKAVIFTDYKGMTVAELYDLRRLLREGGVEYRVVKNTLARIAAQDTPVSAGRDAFKGPVAVAIGYDDPVTAAKKVLEFSKKNEKLKLRGGVIEGKFFGVDEVKDVATLPSREVLLSMMAGAFQAPLSKLAAALSATVSSFAYAVHSLKTKRES
ncbi:MAG TPA: 50S ribosomal protein L10 [Thermodesulfovibrionales bacterium]|jgi:large subunit ribosomal protein L10|nr:50S ribosomal protein L10 [Thermodesulfovibrionales bacterium]